MSVALPDLNRMGCAVTPDMEAAWFKLPTIAAEYDIKYKAKFDNFPKIMKSIKYKPGANSHTLVINEPPPDQRVMAFPSLICETPTVDVTSGMQRTVELQVRRKRFESPMFCWETDWRIFVQDRVKKNLEYILQQQERFKNLFYRTAMFHDAPNMVFLGKTPSVDESAPTGFGNEAGTAGKSLNYLAAKLTDLSGKMGYLSLANLTRLLAYLEDSNVVPMTPGTQKENAVISEGYTLMVENADYRALASDPQVRAQNLGGAPVGNFVNGTFKGMLLGSFNVMPHTAGVRFYQNADGSIEIPERETRIVSGPYRGRPVLTEKYRKAQYALGFAIGADSHAILDPGGPPPGWKARESNGTGLFWTGRPELTDKFMVDCADPANPSLTIREMNTYGEKMKWIAQSIMGISAITPHNCVPFVYQRNHAVVESVFSA